MKTKKTFVSVEKNDRGKKLLKKLNLREYQDKIGQRKRIYAIAYGPKVWKENFSVSEYHYANIARYFFTSSAKRRVNLV